MKRRGQGHLGRWAQHARRGPPHEFRQVHSLQVVFCCQVKVLVCDDMLQACWGQRVQVAADLLGGVARLSQVKGLQSPLNQCTDQCSLPRGGCWG